MEDNGPNDVTEQVGALREVTSDIAYMQTYIVNLYFVGEAGGGDGSWALVDTGMPGSAARIAKAAETRFGGEGRPAAIILTHGHFDHTGGVEELAERWDVPVYAHELELPYLTGRSDYPPPDPTVGGGVMAMMSWLFPKSGIDLGERVLPLPADGSVPGLPAWRWIHTPGHTAGHISLFRSSDRALIAGDAFVTVKQESALAVMTQRQEVHGPPSYFTTDWRAARRSVEQLASLRPFVVATGHGIPMRGERMQQELTTLAHDFERLAVPAHGRYVGHPALTDAGGVVSVPPPVSSSTTRILIAAGVAAVAGIALALLRRGGAVKA